MVREIVRVNQRVYNEMKAEDPGFYRGNPASKLANKRELVGYVPMEKRVTSLMAAGLRTAAVRDQEYFDTINDDGNIPPIPPLPRHMPADLADVSDLAREYMARRREIEARVVEARQKAAEKPQEGPQGPSNAEGGSTPPPA